MNISVLYAGGHANRMPRSTDRDKTVARFSGKLLLQKTKVPVLHRAAMQFYTHENYVSTRNALAIIRILVVDHFHADRCERGLPREFDKLFLSNCGKICPPPETIFTPDDSL